MSVRAVVVAHRETMAAEGIAAALTRYPAIAIVGIATSAAETERRAEGADAVASDARIPGAEGAVVRMRRRGLRVVVIDGASPAADEGEGGVIVAVGATVAHLASALAPGAPPRASWGMTVSPREGQVLRLAAKGMAGKQIARVLGISPKTVEQHKTRAFKRLHVTNQAAAIAVLTEGDRAWSPSIT
ncbi:MAG: LuxR C-terminal-related transcriptional regulator [Actinomycetota bacterium]